jgi:hypothetical protein
VPHRPGRIDQLDFHRWLPALGSAQSAAHKALAEIRDDEDRAHTVKAFAATHALRWSITAMSDTAQRLSQVAAWDRARAFAAIGEAVWWVTIVDATLVRHHLTAYDDAMAGQTLAGRQLVEQTLAGLRFVRNRIGDEADLAEFIEPGESGPDTSEGGVTGWIWKPAPEPKLASLSPARAVMGDAAAPGVSGPAGGPHRRGDFRASRGIP